MADDHGHEPGERRRPAPLVPALSKAGFIEYDRVLFFSDAVFAIAITLLAIDLRVPSDVANIGTVLRNEGRFIEGFVISFAVIGLFWLGHHGIFRYITALNRPLIGLNLLFLGTVAFLPYPTSLLSATDQTGSVVFYAICASLPGLVEALLWLYAVNSPQLVSPAARAARWPTFFRIIRAPVIFGISIPFAFVYPSETPYLWILIAVAGIVIDRYLPHEPPERIEE